MQVQSGRVHHIVGLVRPENFGSATARMQDVLGAPFHPPVERPEFGMQGHFSRRRCRTDRAPFHDCRTSAGAIAQSGRRARVEPSTFGGLPVILAEVDYRN